VLQTDPVDYPDDPGLRNVLRHLGVPADSLLGHGGEAWVYALDDNRVVRVPHSGADADQLLRNHALVRELSSGKAPFDLPRLIEVSNLNGRVFAIEQRLAGRDLLSELTTAEGTRRDKLIGSYLDTAEALGDLPLDRPDYFGDLAALNPVRTRTWREYLTAKADASLLAGPITTVVDTAAIAADLPEPSATAFVHLDAFAGNMMTDGHRVTAVVDVGLACVAGDARMNLLAAVVNLETAHTPTATSADMDTALARLSSRGLIAYLETARAWLAAFWSFAWEDPVLISWCRSVLHSRSVYVLHSEAVTRRTVCPDLRETP
jgi:aminoglycoside phosphotransferase (APT) family kinase protein